MTFITTAWKWLTGQPWLVALVKWLAIGAAGVTAFLLILSRAKKQGQDQELARQATAGAEIEHKQAQVPQPLPGQTQDRLDKGTF